MLFALRSTSVQWSELSPPTLLDVPGGSRVALYRLGTPGALPAVVVHGTISDARSVFGLARAVASIGLDVWMLEWGGHGQSRVARSSQNFEYPALHDVPTAIDHILAATGQPRLFWVSHSGGGHLALMHLARSPERQRAFAGIVTMGAQATSAFPGFVGRSKLHALRSVTLALSRTPSALLPRGCDAEPSRLLAQWADWNLARRWLGSDGFDYEAALGTIDVPVLSVAGRGDPIAPLEGCERLFSALGSSDRTFRPLGVRDGFSRDFNHGGMVRGEAARTEVFPVVTEWLRARPL